MANPIRPEGLPAVPGGNVAMDAAIIIDDGAGVWKASPSSLLADPAAAAAIGTADDSNVQAGLDARPTSAILAAVGGAEKIGTIAPHTGAVPETAQAAIDRLALSPEQFGAVGDGATDDTVAFQALGAAITAAGGGTIQLRKGATYRVGQQTFSGVADGAAYRQQNMLRIDNANGLVIEGNGATLKLNDGLRYGSFDPVTGAVFNPPGGGFTDANYAATVGHILEINNSRNVMVRNLTTYGNQANLVKGGYWGDTGIQRRANGITLSNVSNVSLVNVTSNENGLDGLYVQGNEKARYGTTWDGLSFENVVCDRNGRQGCSIVGGRGITFTNCAFTNTAQGAIASLPMAGVDIEPNGSDWATEIIFSGCAFENNRGAGLLCDAAFNARNLTVRDCIFWQGFTNSGDALWLAASPLNALVAGCYIYGCVSNSHANNTFRDCLFDGSLAHPTYGTPATNRTYLFDPAKSSFFGCKFVSLNRRTINATAGAVFEKCEIKFTGSMAAGTTVSSITGCKLVNVAFTEDCNPAPSSITQGYLIARSSNTQKGVTVQGPYVGWAGVPSVAEPRIGEIRQVGDAFLFALDLSSGISETTKCRITFGASAPTSATAKGDFQFNVNATANGILGWQCLDPTGAGTYQAIRGIVQQTGWTAGTGTANKGAFAAYAGQTHTASYVQATIQALDDAVKAASQRIKALEDTIRAAGIIN